MIEYKNMCLAIPGKILEIDENNTANVDFNGVLRMVSVAMLQDACIGDYVLVHAGFAIEKVDVEEAQKTISLLNEIG